MYNKNYQKSSRCLVKSKNMRFGPESLRFEFSVGCSPYILKESIAYYCLADSPKATRVAHRIRSTRSSRHGRKGQSSGKANKVYDGGNSVEGFNAHSHSLWCRFSGSVCHGRTSLTRPGTMGSLKRACRRILTCQIQGSRAGQPDFRTIKQPEALTGQTARQPDSQTTRRSQYPSDPNTQRIQISRHPDG